MVITDGPALPVPGTAVPGQAVPGQAPARPDAVESLVRAASLAERLAGGARVPGGDPTRTGRRLARWREREPFDRGDWWRARLDEGGVDEGTLAALLAEPVPAMARRLPRMDWADRFAADMFGLDSESGVDSDRDSDSGVGDDPPDTPFLPLVAPLLAATRRRLRTRLGAVVQAVPVFTPDTVVDQMYPALAGRLHRMLERTAVLELNVARLSGRLAGDTAQARFAAFVDGLRGSARRCVLFAEYPSLARQLSVAAHLWEDAAGTFAERLAADAERIRDTFAPGGHLGHLGHLDQVTTGLGDRHRGGASVMAVRFTSGLRLIYKPRPVAVDVHFQRMLGWLNGHGVTTPFRQLSYLERDGYGWAEFVTARPCPDEPARRRFYRRQGGLLAVLHVLRATDFHSENLVAAEDQPVLVDLESLLDPGLPDGDADSTGAERLAVEATRGSVLGVGLLPARIWALQPEDSGTDLSGLGAEPGALSPLSVPTARDTGTDRMRIELNRPVLGGGDHRPVGKGVPLRLLDYTEDILDGYTEVYRICAGNRDELAADGGPVSAFAGDEVRVILRPTMWYALVSQTSFHPDLLRDGLDQERHFDLLWRQVPAQPLLGAVTAAERADLWQGDIPVFTARTDQPVLYDSRRQPVPGLDLVPGLDRARQRLAELGDADLARQRWLVRGSLGTTAVEAAGTGAFPSYQVVPAGEPIGRDRLLAVADTVGYRLDRIAFQHSGSAQWLGVVTVGGSWAVGPLQADLFHGLSGVALFLAWLGELTGDRSRTRLARGTLATVLRQLDRGRLDGTNGFAGLPGAAYALAQVARLWDDERLLDTAEGLFDRLGQAVDTDTDYDFTAGSAGTLAAARALYQIRPSDRLADQVDRCAARLLATARRYPTGIGWLPRLISDRSDRPIAGFAHGVGGIAWTLFAAADLLGEQRYAEAAREAVRYEQALFRPDEGDWADLRDPAKLGLVRDEHAQSPVAWCYGAMGIGLARLLCLPYLPGDPLARQEVDAALDTTGRAGFGLCHALCHGDVGNTELFLHAAGMLGEPRWRREAAGRLATVVTSAARGGWVCGTPLGVQTPGMMVGLAGTGYGMLRAAEPDRVPSVLTLAR